MSRSSPSPPKGRGRGRRPKKYYSLKPRSADPLIGSVLIQAWICQKTFEQRVQEERERGNDFTISKAFNELKEYCLLREVTPELHIGIPPRGASSSHEQCLLFVRIDDDETNQTRFKRQCWRMGFHTKELREAYLPSERVHAERRRS
jgi:hypothetical protein